MPTKRTGNPRGRPPGVKNKPKTIEQFIITHTAERPAPPPRAPKTAARGPMAKMTPEERKAYGHKLVEIRKAKGITAGPSSPDIRSKPSRLTGPQYRQMKIQVRPEVKRIMKKMAEDGTLPEDVQAQKIIAKAVEKFLIVDDVKSIVSLGRLVLDFTKAKPAQKIDVTTRTHEDFLDELAVDDTSKE